MREGTKWGIWDHGILYNKRCMINMMYFIGMYIFLYLLLLLALYEFSGCIDDI